MADSATAERVKDSLASEHISSKPEVQPHAIENGVAWGSGGDQADVAEPKKKKRRKTTKKTKAKIENESKNAAHYTVDGIEVIATMLGGDEFRYQKSEEYGIDERESGYEVWQRFYEEKGITDIPPGFALALWGVDYAGSRLAMPKTQSRVKSFWGNLKQKFFRRRPKKVSKKEAEKMEADDSPNRGGFFSRKSAVGDTP